MLTRSEAARYVGASGESTIRAAEANGLRYEQDDEGLAWHLPHLLDAWEWRVKSPSAAQRARVIREAARSRRREAEERERRVALEFERQAAEWDAERARDESKRAAENTLREEVRRQNNETRAAFELHHMDEATAGRALEFPSYEARYRLRDLVRRGLLRRVDSPHEVRVEWSLDGARAVETHWPLCAGAPFFFREEVLALRQNAATVAAKIAGREPAAARALDSDDLLRALLGLVLKHARGSLPP
ncbi:MAG TPA: hypothetical protein VFK05_07390 [Polyangiaceae bacterium]|nr:hypothetical protein [Polyangiaceae bacterium]